VYDRLNRDLMRKDKVVSNLKKITDKYPILIIADITANNEPYRYPYLYQYRTSTPGRQSMLHSRSRQPAGNARAQVPKARNRLLHVRNVGGTGLQLLKEPIIMDRNMLMRIPVRVVKGMANRYLSIVPSVVAKR
jgi:hypothetical protein